MNLPKPMDAPQFLLNSEMLTVSLSAQDWNALLQCAKRCADESTASSTAAGIGRDRLLYITAKIREQLP